MSVSTSARAACGTGEATSFNGPSMLHVQGAPPERMLRKSSLNRSASLQHLATPFAICAGSSGGNSAQDTNSEDFQHFSVDSASLQSMTGVSSAAIGNAALLTSGSSSPDKHSGLNKVEHKGTTERGDTGGSTVATSAAAVVGSAVAPERRKWQAPQAVSALSTTAVAHVNTWVKDPGMLTARSHVQHSTLGTVFESDSPSPLQDVDGSTGVFSAPEAITEDELEDAGRTKPLDVIFGAMRRVDASSAAAEPAESQSQSRGPNVASTHLLDRSSPPFIAEGGPSRPPDPSISSGTLAHARQASSSGSTPQVHTSSSVSGRQHSSSGPRSSDTSGVWIQLPGFPSAAPQVRPPAEQS
jgi:hypothetical protein